MSEMYWRNEEMFWEVIQTTPSEDECLQLLRGVRQQLIFERAKLASKGLCCVGIDARLSEIGDKIKETNIKIENARWKDVITDLWGDDGWKKACAHKCRLFADQQGNLK